MEAAGGAVMDAGRATIHVWAFFGFVHYMAYQPEAIERFQAETGTKYVPARTPLDAMIDKATGIQREAARQFIQWCAVEYGKDSLPADIAEILLGESK
jgi:hypothetical protein